MHSPTCDGLRIRSAHDARVIFHAVACGILPLVTKRLPPSSRNSVGHGNVYVWEEKPNRFDLTATGMERWTDGIPWSPSRTRREGFIFYHQDPEPSKKTRKHKRGMPPADGPSEDLLTKQTFAVTTMRPYGKRRWHLVAYFTPSAANELDTIEDRYELANLLVPHERFQSAAVFRDHDTSPGRSYRRGSLGGSSSASSDTSHVDRSPSEESLFIQASGPVSDDFLSLSVLDASYPRNTTLSHSAPISFNHKTAAYSPISNRSNTSSPSFSYRSKPLHPSFPAQILTPSAWMPKPRLAPIEVLQRQSMRQGRRRVDQNMLDMLSVAV